MAQIRVVAAIVDTVQLTLYKENGETLTIPQGDPRLRKIIADITPYITQNLVAIVDLDEENPYAAFQEAVESLIKIYRVDKVAVAHIFGGTAQQTVAPVSLGSIPDGSEPKEEAPAIPQPKVAPAIEDIIAHATPVSSPEYATTSEKADDTHIAVVAGKVIPNIEKLKDQFVHANSMSNSKGLKRFLERLAAVIDDRGHTVEEILTFMQRADLPIADDGSIVSYKVLKTVRGSAEGFFFDCHTGKVPQRLGSHVSMDKKLVDPSKRLECSQGLHIARRRYLGGFSGDIITICKIAPEDVIAVPNGEPDKVRVCGYHIVGVIPANLHGELRSNKPMTDSDSKIRKMLGDIIKGNHIGIIEKVVIGSAKGGDVKVTPVNRAVKQHDPKKKAPEIHALDAKKTDSKVDPTKVATDTTEAKKQTAGPAGESRNDKAKRLYQSALSMKEKLGYRQAAATALLDLKKTSKVSWEKLGLTNDVPDQMNKVLETKEKPEPKKKEPKPVTEPKTEAKSETREQTARKYFEQRSWSSLWILKKKAKRTWKELGFTPKEEERIKLNKPDLV